MRKGCSLLLAIVMIILACTVPGYALGTDRYQDMMEQAAGYAADEEYEKAFAAYDLAMQLDPEKTDAYITAGNLYFQLNMYDEAEEMANKSLTVDPLLTDGWLLQCRLDLVHSDIEKLDQDIIYAQVCGADLKDYYQEIASAYESAGESEKAALYSQPLSTFENIQSIMVEKYLGGEKPLDARQTFWRENGEPIALISYSVHFQDGQISYDNPIAFYMDHFQVTGEMLEDKPVKDPVPFMLIQGDEAFSLKIDDIKHWRKADPDSPAFFLQVVSEGESLYQKLIPMKEEIYESDGHLQATFFYDDWGGLKRIAWGEDLSHEWVPTEQQSTDADGNQMFTYDMQLSFSLEESDTPVSWNCVSTKVYNSQGDILTYSYTGVDCLEEFNSEGYGDSLKIFCQYEYNTDGTLSALHRTKNDISEDIWYYPDGRIRMKAISGEMFSFYFYDENGEIEDMYVDRAGTWEKYSASEEPEKLRNRLSLGIEDQIIESYHFDPQNHSILYQSYAQGHLEQIEYVVSALSMAEKKSIMINSDDFGIIRDMQFDDLHVPILSNSRDLEDGEEVQPADNTKVIYQSKENPKTGRREYYKTNEDLMFTIWSESADPDDAVFNSEM